MLQTVSHRYRSGALELADLREVAQLVTQAELELSDDPGRKVAALEKLVEMAKFLELSSAALARAGRETEAAVVEARYHRLDAEVRLMRARQAARTQKQP